jgi:hypothetical protein
MSIDFSILLDARPLLGRALPPVRELAARGASINELRAVHRVVITTGQFVAEPVLTDQTREKTDNEDRQL